MAEQTNSTNLAILSTPIRRDAEGRYCLNDCHKAAGAEKKDGPSYWLETDQAAALAKEIRSTGKSVDPVGIVATGPNNRRGTYVAKELIYAYAMWISPSFHLTVIRAFDGLVGNTLPAHVAVASFDADARRAFGGIMKAVAGKALDDRLAPIETAVLALDQRLRSIIEGFDPRVVVTDFQPMLEVLIREGVMPKKRRALSQRCSRSCLRFCITSEQRQAFRLSRETGRYLFQESVVREWLDKGGRRMIVEHKEMVSGQTVLPFVKPKASPKPGSDAPAGGTH